jgi:hypothetical protein
MGELARRQHQVGASGSLVAMMRRVGWMLLGVALAAGCGSSKSYNSSASPPRLSTNVAASKKDAVPAANGTADLLNPPANIDVKSCVQHKLGARNDLAPLDACRDCCGKRGFMIATFQYRDLCTCGNPLQPLNDKVCATPEALASEAACATCCKKAKYPGHECDSGMGLTSCVCEGRIEYKACAGTATREACTVCCYNGGYFGVSWTAPSDCVCSG